MYYPNWYCASCTCRNHLGETITSMLQSNSPWSIVVLFEIKPTAETWSLFRNPSLLKWSYVYTKNSHHFEFTLVTVAICSKLTYHPFWKENHFVEAINRSEQRRLLVIKQFNVMERIIIFKFPTKCMTRHVSC